MFLHVYRDTDIYVSGCHVSYVLKLCIKNVLTNYVLK